MAQLVVVTGQIQSRNLGLPQDIGETRHHHIAQLIGDFVGGETTIGADDLAQKDRRVLDSDRVTTKSPQPNGAEFGITQHHRVLCTPLEVGETAGAEEIDLGLERTLQAMSPGLQGRKNGQIVGL